MKTLLRFLYVSLFASFTAGTALAQQQPVLAVRIIAPFNESSGASGLPVSISALATGTTPSSGFEYSFSVNGVFIGTSINNRGFASVPGIVQWTPPAPGVYFFTVTASDGISPAVPSLPIRYFATGAVINSPSDPTLVPAGSSVVIKADATPAQGFVRQIEFFVDGVSVGIDTTYPYSFIYKPSGSSGAHSIFVTATDNLGSKVGLTSTPISLQMTPPIGTPPSSVVTSPATAVAIAIPNYSTDAGASIPINVNANAPSGTIAKVETYIDGILVNSDTSFPYSFAWKPTVVGTFIITALAFDDKNNVVASAPVSVPISAPPSVAISSPASGSVLAAGVPVFLTANASDSDGTVASVQFFADGKIIATATAVPYIVSYSPTAKPDSTATVLTAVVTDNLGLTTTSNPVSVTVSNGSGGGAPIGQPPVVAITSPVAGSQIIAGTTVSVSANASDSDGNIVSVQFFVNNIPFGTDVSYPYSATWTPNSLGSYSITAKALDNEGNTATSSVVNVTVMDPTPGIPTVAITAPSSGSSIIAGTPQIVTATAVDDGIIVGVQFFVNGLPLGGIVAGSPYRTSWMPTAPGSYLLTARATDNSGNQGTSLPSIITVTANSSPTVSLISPGTNLTVALGTSINVSASASDSDGSVTSIAFIANGTTLATKTSAPYSTAFLPSAPGVYSIVAQAQDNSGNVTNSTPLIVTVLGGDVPMVTLNSPESDTTISADSSLLLSASASVSSGNLSKLEFYAGGALLTTMVSPPYTYVWRPAGTGIFTVRAVAYAGSGAAGVSSSVSTVTVRAASAAPGARTIALTNPTNNQTIVAFRNITFSAVTNIADSLNPQIDFYANGRIFDSVTARPYQSTRNATIPGRNEFYAVVRVNGATYTSAPVFMTVTANLPPSVAISAPSSGATISVGTTVTVRAAASDPDDAVASVQFLVNGQPLSTALTYPYFASWLPGAEGVYTISAIVKDSLGSLGGNETTSAPIYVRVVAPAGGGGTAPDVVYGGNYLGASESGKFAVINLSGKNAAFIGYSTGSPAKIYFYSGLPIDGGGNFSKADSAGRVFLNGVASGSGVSGNLDAGRLTYIGPIAFGAGTASAPSGYYAGSLSGKSDSSVSAIVGPDGTIMIYVASGTTADAGSGSVLTNGAFSFRTVNGNTFTGKVDPATGLLTGSLSGASGGVVTGALTSGGSFSDGSLRNLSTRGQVGTGANILIAGFVVGGTTPKQVLIRAIGPSLTQFGITGALSDPQLSIFRGSTLVGLNDNWDNSAPLAAASAQVGAFPLDPAAKDAAILTTLTPGAYTAQVSGVGGTSGVALVELYDLDAISPFSPQKIMNVASRGVVGSGQGALIAGFIVNGTVPKKVLVRAVGPGLTALGVAGALADPVLRIIRNDNLVIRENDNWEMGNDGALITDASTKSGAFALVAGSKDAALLFSLPPGTYTAQVVGAGGTGGVALVEVYEVP